MRFKFRRYYLYYLGRVAAFLFSLLPLNMAVSLAKIIGRLAFFMLPRYRRITIANLKSAFCEEKTDREIKDIAMRVFENLGKNAAELINFPNINKGNIDRLVQIENKGIFDRALEKGRGLILLTGHFGNWELLGMAMRVKGYPGAAIGRRIYFDRYDRYLNRLRKIHDVNIIYREDSPKKMLRVLRDNGVLGILADQDVDSVEGVFVNFFGRPAYTAVGPVALAMASGASLIPAFIIRSNGSHRIVVQEPVNLVNTGDRDKDILANTQAWSDVMESFIRRYPDHWVWMHRRWKTKRDSN